MEAVAAWATVICVCACAGLVLELLELLPCPTNGLVGHLVTLGVQELLHLGGAP